MTFRYYDLKYHSQSGKQLYYVDADQQSALLHRKTHECPFSPKWTKLAQPYKMSKSFFCHLSPSDIKILYLHLERFCPK